MLQKTSNLQKHSSCKCRLQIGPHDHNRINKSVGFGSGRLSRAPVSISVGINRSHVGILFLDLGIHVGMVAEGRDGFRSFERGSSEVSKTM